MTDRPSKITDLYAENASPASIRIEIKKARTTRDRWSRHINALTRLLDTRLGQIDAGTRPPEAAEVPDPMAGPRVSFDDLTSDQLDQLYDERDRYRTAWQSARHRAALYLQSNRNFATSLDNGHTAWLQANRRIEQLTAGRATWKAKALEQEQAAEQAEAAIERVRAIHSRGARTNACNDCGQPWPCELTRALDQAQQPTTTEA